MNAKEANRLTWEVINEQVPENYKSIKKKIEKAVSRGQFGITYSDNFNKEVFIKLRDLLLDEGYKTHILYNNSKNHGSLEIRW